MNLFFPRASRSDNIYGWFGFLSSTSSLGESSMKRVAHFLVVAGLAGAWAGCAKEPQPVQTSQSKPSSSETVLVKLSVPNMT